MRKVQLNIPRWVTKTYLLLAVILLPWTVYLLATLPARHLSRHWDLSWGGLDIALIITFVATALLGWKRSKWIVFTATAAGTLMLTDAWFDVLSERPGAAFLRALVMAVCIEVPLALISFAIALRVIAKSK